MFELKGVIAELARAASMLDVAVVWLSRDLRLHDNPALSAALLAARKVVRCFLLLSPAGLWTGQLAVLEGLRA